VGGYHIPRHMVLFNDHNLRWPFERTGLRVVDHAHLASSAFWVQPPQHWLAESTLAALAPLCGLLNVPLVAAFVAFDLIRARAGVTSNPRLVAQRLL